MSQKPSCPSQGNNVKKKREYKVSCRMQDGRMPVFGGAFNVLDKNYFDMFASVNANRVTVYRCAEDGQVNLVQAYVDELKEENFYTVCWMREDKTGHPILAASGFLGSIRIIDCFTEAVVRTLTGHGNSVNELRCQPLKTCLLLSASKDESVRLWNVASGVCVLILAGAAGHRNEVLSADFHPSDIMTIVSCGMDATIRIWSLKDFWYLVEKSFTWSDDPAKFPTRFVNYPAFVAMEVHTNYVDCVRWNGNLLLSKSVDNEVILWKWIRKPEEGPAEGSAEILQRYAVPECDIWFMKFSLNLFGTVMAIGNREGKAFVWDLDCCPPPPPIKLTLNMCKSPIRQTAVSYDGRIVMCCCEDGQIWRWDVKTNQDGP